ncbi:sugar O-acetyltransferase [Vagococcus silagei]|uniref:Acetyltransferase n=1 Tax=Vagococcus silagei TaxID=2508885 RepID=A0A4S3B0P0_9ENTE|nr:sugar O-acetyltransferase [Vagococcus silagei]THB60644.1 sugar O-acetyltransferase [Vagococcus silagei]
MKETEYERMITGKLYLASKIEAAKSYTTGQMLTQKINQTPLNQPEEVIALEKQLFGSTGESLFVQPPVFVDYGFNTHVGENFYANGNCHFLDVAEIFIGNNVMLGPRVTLVTAGHPIDAGVRRRGLEFGYKIRIEDDVWMGANVTVNPGVTVGARSIIGSGAVVTKDIPSDVIAVGNPARVLRKITDADREYWEKAEEQYFIETSQKE